MLYMKCLSKCPYSKKPVLPQTILSCKSVTLILIFHPNIHPNIWVTVNFPIYRKLIHDNINHKNQESFIQYYFEGDINTAQKTTFSFSKCSKNIIFPKQLHWNMIFLVLSRKIIFLFSENMMLFFRRKMKDDLSKKKIHGNMIYSSNVLKRWSSQKNCIGI